ncbi:MAG: DUF4910 domain-containing protein [Bacteroidales bacterium]|nr:DUF4910 domain-containing protein [Bacteroidales bacterium]
MKSFFIIYILLLSSFQQVFSQNREYAEEVLNKVCSEEFHGRGYGFGGDKITSAYIIKELKKKHIKPVSKTYLQKFTLNTNTLYGNNKVVLNNIKLIPGVDYIISSKSCSVKGKFPAIYIGKKIIDDSIKFRNLIYKDLSEKVIIIDTAGIERKSFSQAYDLITQKNILKAKAVIKIEDNNLTYVPSQEQKNFALITVKRNALLKNIKSANLDIESRFLENYETQNIIGYIKGKTDTSIVLSAHYDHLGHMGYNTYFPGANDNGSGIAMLLNLAKYFSKQKKPKYNIVFMFFAGEELGLLGSKFYTENPLFPLNKIKFLINLDMVGSGDKGIKVVNGSVFKKEFDKLTEINNKNDYLPAVKIRGAAANSDHYFFYANGVKSFFIYTLGEYKEYHNINDNPENLPLNEFEDLTLLLIDFINSF